MKIIERLYQYFDKNCIKPTYLEKQLGISNGYFGVQKKRNADTGEGQLVKILDYCRDLNPEWLLTGCGDMIKNAPNSNSDNSLISIIEKKDELIIKQAEEIGRLREQLEQIKGKDNAWDVDSSLSADVG